LRDLFWLLSEYNKKTISRVIGNNTVAHAE